MARPVTINYKKVTLSLPRKVVDILESRVNNGMRSKFVADAICEKAGREKEEMDVHEFFEDFWEKYPVKPGSPSSLEILRKYRYEIK